MTFRCSGCGIAVESKARSEDAGREKLAENGWVTWLPHKKLWCPTCGTEMFPPVTV